MTTKFFEVRDRATFLPVVATLLESSNAQDSYLLARAGYGRGHEPGGDGGRYILLARLSGGEVKFDPYDWKDRTMSVVHNYIVNNWDIAVSGQVVDVEFILGETSEPKVSESEVDGVT